jgi:CopG family nickel-responsive transcriptional regulator
MQRITISLPDTLGEAIDAYRHERGYETRSEAMRDLVREGIERWQQERTEAAVCVANLSYVFDRRVRALPQRLAEMQHARHDLVIASTAVRLDHFHTMETVLLRGETQAVRAFADQLRAERGVRSGSINLLTVQAHDHHEHGHDHDHHGLTHLSPLT